MTGPGEDPPSARAGDPPDAQVPRAPLRRVIGQIAGVNFVVVLAGLLTGPLQARALGPDGRGDLAAIMVPLGLAPMLLTFGLGSYAIYSGARGAASRSLLGSLLPIYLIVGCLTAVLAPTVARFFAEGRETVETFITIGLWLLPLGLFTSLLTDLAVSQQRWRQLIQVRLIPPIGQAMLIVALFTAGALTVQSAALVFLCVAPLTLIPLWGVLREATPPRFDLASVRAAVPFGAKAWVGGLGQAANARLDQLLMIKLVSPSELGLYVVAVTVSGFLVNPVVNAVATANSPRIAQGDRALIGRSVRTSLVAVGLTSVGLAAVSPWLLRLAFGAPFVDALPIALVLLAASVPLAGTTVLGSALSSAGRPGVAASAELVSLAVTIPSLILLLPVLGALGAALTSLVAYTVTLGFLLFRARAIFGGKLRDYCVPNRQDLADLRSRLPSPRSWRL